MKTFVVPTLEQCKKHCSVDVTGTNISYFLDNRSVYLAKHVVINYGGSVLTPSVPSFVHSMDWVAVCENKYLWPISLIERIHLLDSGYPASSQVFDLMFDDEPTVKILVCKHVNKYVNGIGALSFVVCPDCKEEVK